MTIEFRSTIRIRGVNPYVVVPRGIARALRPSWRRPLPAVVRLRGRAAPILRTSLMPVGDGSFLLYLPGGFRKASGTAVGHRVRLALEFDRSYRGGPQQAVPRWFSSALRVHPDAARNWRALPPSRKKEIVRYFVRLQSTEAKTRNLRRALHVLAGHPARFLGRDWVDGS